MDLHTPENSRMLALRVQALPTVEERQALRRAAATARSWEELEAGRGDRSSLDGEEPAREPEQLEEGEDSDQGDDEPIDWGNVFSEAKAMIELNPNATGD